MVATKKKRLTNAEKRVAIAKDVLENLDRLKVRQGNYICGTLLEEVDPKDNAQEKVKAIQAYCTVCALGACLLSHIRLWDRVMMGEIAGTYPTLYLNVQYAGTTAPLKRYFTQRQLNLIESAFEMRPMNKEHAASDEEIAQAKFFGLGYINSQNRLKAIMENIIENEGTFKPCHMLGKLLGKL